MDKIPLPEKWPVGVTFLDWLAYNATPEDIEKFRGEKKYSGQETTFQYSYPEARYQYALAVLRASKEAKKIVYGGLDES